MTREEANNILTKYVKSVHLIKHCVAVEIAMRAYAEKFGEDIEYWGRVGLLHDIDFELYPEEHLLHSERLLKEAGLDDQFVTDVISHNRKWEPERTLLQKTLLAVDEMSGFIIACALVRPDKSLDNLEVKSVNKKIKDKAFARAVNRETLKESSMALGIELNEHIEFLIKSMAKLVKEKPYSDYGLI